MKKNKDIDTNGLNEIIHLSKNLLRLFYILLILGIVLSVILVLSKVQFFPFFMGILKVISPLFIGFAIAWLVYPLHRKLIDKGMNKILSAILIFFSLLVIIVVIINIFVPILTEQVNDLVSFIPSILSSFTDFVSNALNKIDIGGIDISSIKTSLLSAGQDFIINFSSKLPNSIIEIIKGFISGLGTILISFVVAIYMLIDFDNLIVGLHKILPVKDRQMYIDLFHNISTNARKVVNGTLFVAFMVFVFDSLGFMIAGLNASILFGLFCGLTDLIPYIGPYIGGIAAVAVGFTQSPGVGIAVLIVAVIVQLLESYILQPMVMSKAMQLNPIAIIIGLLIFGHLFGIPGMILATPSMAIIKEIIHFIIQKHQMSKE